MSTLTLLGNTRGLIIIQSVHLHIKYTIQLRMFANVHKDRLIYGVYDMNLNMQFAMFISLYRYERPHFKVRMFYGVCDMNMDIWSAMFISLYRYERPHFKVRMFISIYGYEHWHFKCNLHINIPIWTCTLYDVNEKSNGRKGLSQIGELSYL